ncbi:MAG: Uma2 family endonuclease [Chloroflexi bacterium]|nr:Uma2 family endonuclease [Chloroflexota bacterium]
MGAHTLSLAPPAPVIMDWPPQGQWTYADYQRLPEDGWRYEVIEGELLMSPAPRTVHQRISIKLSSRMMSFVDARDLGEVYYAPVDVMLGDLATPVEPDVLFISRERLHIVGEETIDGAPDLIVEILSPSNWLADRRTKFRVYALAGVREYWILDPERRTIEVFLLQGQSYALQGNYGPGEAAPSVVLAGFEVQVAEICPDVK